MSSDPFGPPLSAKHPYVSVWYYGDPGSGKSTNLAAGANLGRTAIFPIEPGLEPVALRKLGIDLDNIIPISGVNTRDGIMEYFWHFKKAFKDDPEAFKVIGFDSFTDLVRRSVRTIQDDAFEAAKARAESRGEVFRGKKEVDWSKTGPELSDDIGDIAEHYHDLPAHLAYTSHVRRDEDGEGGVEYGPAVTPGVKKALDSWCKILMHCRQVGRYDDGRLIHIGKTAEGGKYKVKDRTSMLPSPTMVNPTMERIVKYYDGTLTVETDPEQQEFQTWNTKRKASNA